MSREAHVQFCESLGVRFPGATHRAVFAVQASDFVASMVRLDALFKRDKRKNPYQALFEALTAQPKRRERIWYVGIGHGDKQALLDFAEDTLRDLRKRKLIR